MPRNTGGPRNVIFGEQAPPRRLEYARPVSKGNSSATLSARMPLPTHFMNESLKRSVTATKINGGTHLST